MDGSSSPPSTTGYCGPDWPNISGTPFASRFSLSIGFHKIRGLARRLLTITSSRHLHRGWLKEYMMNSSADITSATTLCDVELKRFALALYHQHHSQILRRNGEDKRAEVGQVQCDRAGAFRGMRLQPRLEVYLKREVCDRGAKCLRSLLNWP